MSCDFTTTVNGKWILAGEHAVLRGCKALLFPVTERNLSLTYWYSEEPVRAEFGGMCMSEPQILFWAILERALELLDRPRAEITGKFYLQNTIPVSSGMGASAALCVTIARWFCWQGWVEDDALYDFARRLENLFHGESSGADIAVVLAQRGVVFCHDQNLYPLIPQWKPKWYLSYSGNISVTSQCVNRVKKLWDTAPDTAKGIDELMKESVENAEKALQLTEADGFPLLVKAINKARNAFESWGLASGNVAQHMELLERHGAHAVKPVGSGDGGFVLSLWTHNPDDALEMEFIPL